MSKSGKICAMCKNKSKFVLKGIISAAVYDSGPTKEIIHHLKYSGMTGFSVVLAELIIIRLSSEQIPSNAVVVPVPLHPSRLAERGFNQSELIGKYVANKLNLCGGNTLERVRNTKPQAELKRSQRLSNLSGCFRVVDPDFIAGKTVLLIDDVATTGATLNECAKVLKSSGAKDIWGVVVAHR
jgi:ComF family protein